MGWKIIIAPSAQADLAMGPYRIVRRLPTERSELKLRP